LNSILSILAKMWFVFPISMVFIGLIFAFRRNRKKALLRRAKNAEHEENQTIQDVPDQIDETVNPYHTAEQMIDEDETFNAYQPASQTENEETVSPYGWNAAQINSEETVSPYGWNAAQINSEETVSPYGWNAAQANSEETVNPYGWNAAQANSEETVNPYVWNAAQANSEETVNPYSWNAVQSNSEETVNPYSWSAAQINSEETVNPYGWNAVQAGGEETVNPYGSAYKPAMFGAEKINPYAAAAYDEEEETINPYGMDWMPKIAVHLLLEENEKKWKEQITFSGSVWVGGNAKCELRLQNLDSPGYCAELTYGGGNLYVRNLSRGGEEICLDGEPLGDDLVPLKKGSVISMCQIRMTLEYLTNMSFQG